MATQMRKTSIYLPEHLKARLTAAADRTGRSEANLIRSAVEAMLADGGPGDEAINRREDPTLTPRPSAAPALVGIGVGPGTADLLTTRALAELRSADRVFAPCTALDSVGRAETIVREAAPDVTVERLVFVMARAGRGRDDALQAAAHRLADCVAAGERVAFITLGDPNIYSTFSAVADLVREELVSDEPTIVTVPGIMAFQDLAARSAQPLVDADQTLQLVTALDDLDPISDSLNDSAQATVIYKGGRHLPALAERLEAADRLDDAVMGELLGLPGERTGPVRDVADRPASYLATVIVRPKGRAE